MWSYHSIFWICLQSDSYFSKISGKTRSSPFRRKLRLERLRFWTLKNCINFSEFECEIIVCQKKMIGFIIWHFLLPLRLSGRNAFQILRNNLYKTMTKKKKFWIFFLFLSQKFFFFSLKNFKKKKKIFVENDEYENGKWKSLRQEEERNSLQVQLHFHHPAQEIWPQKWQFESIYKEISSGRTRIYNQTTGDCDLGYRRLRSNGPLRLLLPTYLQILLLLLQNCDLRVVCDCHRAHISVWPRNNRFLTSNEFSISTAPIHQIYKLVEILPLSPTTEGGPRGGGHRHNSLTRWNGPGWKSFTSRTNCWRYSKRLFGILIIIFSLVWFILWYYRILFVFVLFLSVLFILYQNQKVGFIPFDFFILYKIKWNEFSLNKDFFP